MGINELRFENYDQNRFLERTSKSQLVVGNGSIVHVTDNQQIKLRPPLNYLLGVHEES